MAESRLVFPTCDSDPLRWVAWMREISAIAQATEKNVRNDDGNRESVNYFILVIMGLRWSLRHDFWGADVADLAQLTPAAIAEHCPNLLPEELTTIEEEIDSYHMRNRKIHRSMQVTIRHAIMVATSQLPFYHQLKTFNRSIGTSDLYQGSRLIAHLMDLMHEFVKRAPAIYMPIACDLALQFKTRPEMQNSEIHELVEELERHLEVLKLSGSPGSEEHVMSMLLSYIEDPGRAVYTTIAGAIRDDPTFANFRSAVIRFIPMDINISRMTAQINTVQSLQIPISRRLKNQVAKKYTPEQQEEHIKKLHTERKLTKLKIEHLREEIERLREELHSKDKEKCRKSKDKRKQRLGARTTAVAAASGMSGSSSEQDSN